MKTWTKSELKAVRKSAGITHAKITTPNGKSNVVLFANLDTLEGVEGKIELGRMVKASKKGQYFQAAKTLEAAPAAPKEGAKAETGAIQAEKPVESGRKAPAKVVKAKAKAEGEKAPKKAKAEKAAGPAREGTKFALIDACVEAGGMTVLEIAEAIVKRFAGTNVKTARHAVNVRCYRRKKRGMVVKLAAESKAKA